MLKTLYDPVVKEEGRKEEINNNIHYLLADLEDYDLHKDKLDDRLKQIKDLSRLREILKVSARAGSVRELMQKLF